jgi:cytochrome c553
MMRGWLVASLVGAAGVTLGAQDSRLVDQGRKAYDAQKCATCHVIAGKGGTMTRLYPLDGIATKMSAADIRRWIVAPAEMEARLPSPPKLKMSAKKYVLSDADVDALAAYMATLKDAKAK